MGEQSVSVLLDSLDLARIPQKWIPILRIEYAQVDALMIGGRI